ncbi:MAG: hypothetical protein ACTSSH_07480 [Candidatus Heimdallarchaeota archaeon]
MSPVRTPKDEEFSEENLIGKSIVDPNGDIIAKCVGVFEDRKKKMRMKIAIKTEINSEFIVKETIPFSSINKIGAVILLKKSFKIQQIAIEDIVTFDIPDKPLSDKKSTSVETKSSTKKRIPEETASKQNKLAVVKEPESKIRNKKSIVSSEQTSKSVKQKLSFNELFTEILKETNKDLKTKKINDLIVKIISNKAFRKKVITGLFNQLLTSEINIRLLAAEIIKNISVGNSEFILPTFNDGLKSVYNEPSKEVEKIITGYLTNLASKYNAKLLDLQLDQFLEKLIIKRDVCKTVSHNRIHNLNLKIFANNYVVQDLIIRKYLQIVDTTKKEASEFSVYLKDYNAIMIAYSMTKIFSQDKWNPFLHSKNIKNTFEQPYIDSINNIHVNFLEGNIKNLAKIVDPKFGIQISNKIIANMIKSRINDFLANVSVLPLEVLTEFFQDKENRTVQIIYDLINKHEINAQIIFIKGKTYISALER